MPDKEEMEKVVKDLEWAINEEEVYDCLYVNDLDGVIETMKAAKEIIEAQLRKTKDDEKPGRWIYYVNEEGRARWKCSECGKVCRRNPHDKPFCSTCGKRLIMEA